MSMINNEKEKKTAHPYGMLSDVSGDYLFNLNESSGDTDKNVPTLGDETPEKTTLANPVDLLGDEWEASKRRVAGVERRWNTTDDSTGGKIGFKDSFTSYMLPKDTPERRRRVYSLSQDALGTAGLVGFEPTNAGVRVLCLAVWRQPNVNRQKALYHVNQGNASPFLVFFRFSICLSICY